MKKFALAAVAALVATVSLAPTAEAGWRHRHHGWHNNFGIVIDVAPRRVVVADYCWTKKVYRYDRWGNLYLKRVKICE